MICILDASAALEIALKRGKQKLYLSVLDDADLILAPDLFIAEITNVFWKYVKFESYDIETCETMLDKTVELVDEYIDSRYIYKEAFTLACSLNHSVYDILYLVLAQKHNATILTSDKKLAHLASEFNLRTPN